ncbi:cache domain-containing protein [Paenibacillus sp. MBLB4367]|uniref:cache domain-containing protein n=1 Tax=Paenibacillus sp. MBLB4367 TaxID=3384767 RepID=UPI003908021F
MQRLAETFSGKAIKPERMAGGVSAVHPIAERVDADGYTAVQDLGLGLPRADVTNETFYLMARSNKTFITDVISGKSLGRPAVVFSSPVTNPNGSFNGVIFGSVYAATLNQVLGKIEFQQTGKTYLLNREGLLLTQPRFTPTAAPLSVKVRGTIYKHSFGVAEKRPPLQESAAPLTQRGTGAGRNERRRLNAK